MHILFAPLTSSRLPTVSCGKFEFDARAARADVQHSDAVSTGSEANYFRFRKSFVNSRGLNV